jgi:hypothetical protein
MKDVWGNRTGNEDVFIWCADELHGFLGEYGHVFVSGISGDRFIGAVVEGNEDVQKNCKVVRSIPVRSQR